MCHEAFYYVLLNSSVFLWLLGLGFVQVNDNRLYVGFYNYGYSDYLLSPLASWSWDEA